MNQNDKHGAGPRMAPSAGPAIAAGSATACASLVGFAIWGLLPEGDARAVLVAAPFLLAPFGVATAVWVASQRALHALLDPIAENVERLFEADSAVPVLPNALETAALAAALERSRLAVAERARTGKIHSAVARLLGAGIGRLAEGDFKARITIDLPAAYRPFQDDFNRAMEKLEANFATVERIGPTLLTHADDISLAASQLSKRAVKLAERIEADLQAIEAGLASEPHEALKLARHTLGGARVASQRNVEAARGFEIIAAHLVAEAARLQASEAVEAEPLPEPQAQRVPRSARAAPASIGSTALKLDD